MRREWFFMATALVDSYSRVPRFSVQRSKHLHHYKAVDSLIYVGKTVQIVMSDCFQLSIVDAQAKRAIFVEPNHNSAFSSISGLFNHTLGDPSASLSGGKLSSGLLCRYGAEWTGLVPSFSSSTPCLATLVRPGCQSHMLSNTSIILAKAGWLSLNLTGDETSYFPVLFQDCFILLLDGLMISYVFHTVWNWRILYSINKDVTSSRNSARGVREMRFFKINYFSWRVHDFTNFLALR